MLILERLTEAIIGAAIEVHRHLGPGLLESSYEECLNFEFKARGLRIQRQVQLPLVYKGLELNCGYRMDFVVSEAIIVELKSVERILPIQEAQLLTYMKLHRKRVGLLINFNVDVLKRGIVRRVL